MLPIHADAPTAGASPLPTALRRVPRPGARLGTRRVTIATTIATALASTLLVTACAGGGGAAQTPAPTQASTTPAAPDQPWPVKTREHVDLWLHGYALLMTDTARVPLFRRDYHDLVVVEKNRRSVTTLLDANRDRLRSRLQAVPALALNPQFVPLYFNTMAELQRAIEVTVQSGGDPQRASDQQTAAMIAFLAQNFPTANDREWLRLFWQSLTDESQKFHHAWWLEQQRARSATLAAVDSAWQRAWQGRLQRFLNGTQLGRGDLVLSLPLDGEGRTVTMGSRSNVVAVVFPDRPQDVADVAYVFAHEVVGGVAANTVRDNVTPAEQRSGTADRLISAAQVRGGLLVVQRIAPELAAGYARYYLRAAKAQVGSDPIASLAAAFPLPQAIADAMARQIDVVLGGI